MNHQPVTTPLKAGLLGLAMLGMSLSAQADQRISTGYDMPIVVSGEISTSDCQNSPGPQITLEGAISLGGIQLELILQNNEKGTHKTTVTQSSTLVLVPLGDEIVIPKQPVQGGVGGNPHLWLQFVDGQGNALGEETYLGRCVQGLQFNSSLLNEALAIADMEFLDCSNKGGPWINISGDIVMSGMKARFIFRNNLKGTHTAEEVRDVELIAEGATIRIPKQPVRGGVGGNPHISARFLDGTGAPITEAVYLGRCNKL